MRYFIHTTLILISLFAISLFSVHAQGTPQLYITWEANNFYPINFEGRAFPSPGTPVTVSVEATIDGKVADLSKAEISWYKDGTRFDYGTGVKESSFTAEELDTNSHFIRVRAVIGSATVEKTIRIPVTKPIAVLEVPYPNRQIPARSIAHLTSIPYFFNATSISNFTFSWQAGDLKKNTKSDNTLALEIGDPYYDTQRTFTVYSYIVNKLQPFEIIKLGTDLYIQ